MSKISLPLFRATYKKFTDQDDNHTQTNKEEPFRKALRDMRIYPKLPCSSTLAPNHLCDSRSGRMNGADALVGSLLAGGVEVCFTNPGTSEIHIVAALDKLPGMRCVLALFEGVVTGAADGYARMAEKPAWTLLHLGPGFANGIANLHNANRANVPLINVIGQHATYHIRHDTPLTSDIETLARPHSNWLRTSCEASHVGQDATEALVAAKTAPGRIATLVLPADVAWTDGAEITVTPPVPRAPAPHAATVDRAAEMLRSGRRTAILLGGNALYGKGLALAGQIAAVTGAKLLAPYPFARLQRGAGLPSVERIPYILEQAIEQLKEFEQLILVGSSPPIAYFAYPGKDSIATRPDCVIHSLVGRGEDYLAALEALVSELPRARSITTIHAAAERPSLPTGEITPAGVAAVIAALVPEGAIVVDESMTSGRSLMTATKGAPQHDWLANTGGSIGIAMPLAVGAAVACPDRPVLCLSADGSGMYTAQALWTMAREGLNVVTVIFSNHDYAVLKREYSYLGVGEPGPRATSLFEIRRPNLDWVHLAKGMGVPGIHVTSLDDFGSALRAALEREGPTLIEVPL